ncbi:MAG: hypothetical protein WC211_00820 [Dehalococcoidia bacterium]
MTAPKKKPHAAEPTAAETTGHADNDGDEPSRAETLPAPAVTIGDRAHYTAENGDGPWHAVVIGNVAGIYTLDVVKPNGSRRIVVAALGDGHGEFTLVA